MEEFVVRPIGVIRSNLKDPGDAPKQGALTDQEAEIVGTPVVDIKPHSPEPDG